MKYHYLASEDDTAGDYGLYRVELAPKAGGPGPHFHRAMSEAFFVLSGAMKLGDMTDDERREWFIANDNYFVD